MRRGGETRIMTETLMDTLLSEIERCSKLKVQYDGIPVGAFGAMMLQRGIDAAKEAIASGDVVKMVQMYKALKRCE
jgi:hypothetical protein